MDIQTLFYMLASIFMFMGILFILGLFFFLWRLEKSALSFKKRTMDRVNQLIGQKKLVGLVSLFGVALKWWMERRNKVSS